MTVPSADTIAAIATATGPAGIGVVRISGPDAFAIADRVTQCRVRAGRQAGHTLRRIIVVDPATGDTLDDGLRAVFHAPHSFTGDDVVEIQGHGGAATLTQTFAACLVAGARAARPGEFSERAFVNNKLDLAQAEAIADLVAAGTRAAQQAARRQLDGDLSRQTRVCREALQTALARLEASIDFPEEVGEIDPPLIHAPLADAQAVINALLRTAGYGRRLREGVTLVLTGRPNVGKSSLLNALSGTDRAIVTPYPGTTRDIIEETLNIGGIPVRALDTAGLRETVDPIEQIGVERARRAALDADVVVLVLEATAGDLSPDERQMLQSLAGRPFVVAINKADLADPGPLVAATAALLPAGNPAPVALSTVTRAGLDALVNALLTTLGAGDLSGDAPLVTSARHQDALMRAGAAIGRAQATLADGLPAELIAVDAHGAMQALGEITGETAREEIIAAIFARFCLGK